MPQPTELFARAVQLAQGEFYLDAIEQFRSLVEMEDAEGLDDDAAYNIGLCFFKMKAFQRAAEQFRRVIEEYPEATIAGEECPGEFGRTAAKAHLGLLMCALATGNRTEADAQLAALQQYPDSYVLEGEEQTRRTFHELGEELIENYDESTVVANEE
jgi:TolA-binding protein